MPAIDIHKPPNTPFLLTTLLKQVSRSFYLTLRVLPRELRQPISLAYLLARAADSIADTPLIPGEKRARLLAHLQAQLHNDNPQQLAQLVADIAPNLSDSAEAQLLKNLESIFYHYEQCDAGNKQHIAHVVDTLISGMLADMANFPPESSTHLAALDAPADLDHYTYLVAGCVGEFWTHMCSANAVTFANSTVQAQADRGIRLGKALQLTNILRDISQDLRIGRCYLPAQQLAQAGLTPDELLSESAITRLRPVLKIWLNTALDHYRAGCDYALAIPRHKMRLRLSVLWPMLIGLATLIKLSESDQWLSPAGRIKVTRRWVYGMIACSLPAACSNRLTQWWINRLSKQVRARIDTWS